MTSHRDTGSTNPTDAAAYEWAHNDAGRWPEDRPTARELADDAADAADRARRPRVETPGILNHALIASTLHVEALTEFPRWAAAAGVETAHVPQPRIGGLAYGVLALDITAPHPFLDYLDAESSRWETRPGGDGVTYVRRRQPQGETA